MFHKNVFLQAIFWKSTKKEPVWNRKEFNPFDLFFNIEFRVISIFACLGFFGRGSQGEDGVPMKISQLIFNLEVIRSSLNRLFLLTTKYIGFVDCFLFFASEVMVKTQREQDGQERISSEICSECKDFSKLPNTF